jgi:hypothetical protein
MRSLLRPPLARWEKVSLTCCAVFTAAWLSVGVPLRPLALRFGLAVVVSLLAAALVLVGRRTSMQARPRVNASPVRLGIFAAVVVAGTMLVSLLAQWPGLMTYDSVDQWRQVVSHSYSDHHPVFDTVARGALIRLFHTPAAIALVQIVLVATSVGWCVGEIARWGSPRLVLLGVIVVSALSPWNLFFAITLWKDVPYAAVFLYAEAALLHVLRADPIESRGVGLALVVSLAGLMLFRHNGIATVVGAALLAFPFLVGRQRRLAAIVVIAALVLYGVSRVTLELTVKPTHDKWFGLPLLAAFQAGSGIVAGEAPDAEKNGNILGRVLPVEDWKRLYDCRSLVALASGPRFDRELLANQPGEIYRVWLSLALTHPATILRHQACASEMLWNFGYSPVYIHEWGIASNPFGLSPRPLLPAIGRLLGAYRAWSLESPWRELVWQPALATLLLLWFVLSGAFTSGSPELLILLVLPAAHVAGLLLTVHSPDVRFQYPIHQLAILTAAAAYLPRRLPEPT